MNYRNIGWSKYLLKKVGGKKEDVAKLYTDRQDRVLILLKESNITVRIFNTSDQNFVKPTREIINQLGFKIIV